MIISNAIITAYCACKLCCGDLHSHSIQHTASGTSPVAGRTVAAPRSVPFGTRVQINNRTYIVEDRTARRFDGRWDIYFDSHKSAVKFGKQRLNVWILPFKNVPAVMTRFHSIK